MLEEGPQLANPIDDDLGQIIRFQTDGDVSTGRLQQLLESSPLLQVSRAGRIRLRGFCRQGLSLGEDGVGGETIRVVEMVGHAPRQIRPLPAPTRALPGEGDVRSETEHGLVLLRRGDPLL